MKKIVWTTGKYLFFMILGVILYSVTLRACTQIRFSRDYEALQTSHDYDRLYRIQSSFLQQDSTEKIVYAVLGREGIQGTLEAKLAALDVIQAQKNNQPSSSLWHAIVDVPYEGSNDLTKELRLKSLQYYDKYLQKNVFTPCTLIAKQLDNEPSPELLDKKLSFIARRLFMDKAELKKYLEENGAFSTYELLREKIHKHKLENE